MKAYRDRVFILGLLGILLIAALGLSGMQALVTQAAQLAVTSTPGRTPTRTPTLTPDLIKRLKNQLSFFPGGGGMGLHAPDCLRSENLPDTQPVIWFYGRAFYDLQEGAICLFGFGVDQPFDINITSSDGADFYSLTVDPATSSGVNNFQFSTLTTDEGVPVSLVRLWLSPDVKGGDWLIDAASPNDYVTGTLPVAWPGATPELFVPREDPNPLILPDNDFYLGDGVYKLSSGQPGQGFPVEGVNLPKQKTIPLAVYQVVGPGELRLVQAYTADTNSQGKLRITLKLPKGLSPGSYYLGAILDLKASSVYSSGPGLGVQIDTCPGALDSRLLVGDTVRIDPQYLNQNKLFSQPGEGAKTGQLGRNLTADIQEGPNCVDQMVWWKVRTSKDVIGWISEGQGEDRFIVRIEP